ncbi:MAG TPA: DNA polymerase/3'-5' exonuclease PolX [Ktedonobacteraceae bacterium]|nr:DNA polymerase/3'-5' exonuclease PolX [Ktedonobacteraceae bacterium]
MDKNQIASLLDQIGILMELKEGSSPFEVRAYQNAARTLNGIEGDIAELDREGRLKGMPGIGPTILKRIEEAINTGHIALYDELVAETPPIKLEMTRLPGIGPKKINAIYNQLHVNSLAELKQAAEENKIAPLPGFGKKTQEKILQGIDFLAQHSDRYLYPVVEAEAERIRAALATLPQIVRLEIAGSLRRRRETVKDIDMVASVRDNASEEERNKIMDFFTSLPSVVSVTGKGPTRSSVVLNNGIAMDLRVVNDSQFPYTLHHFSGSREHHIALRRRALAHNMTINDYGMFRGKEPNLELVPARDEADMYRALGLDYIEPELREDMGEIEAAEKHELPKLVTLSDIRGTLHVHSVWSDGQNTIREMAEACIERGYQYLGITDHSKVAAYAGGLSVEDLKRQGEEIDRLNEEFAGKICILKGTECDILKDGSLDFPDEALASLDFVVASIHSNFNMTEEEETQRMIRAISNPYVNIIGHATGRILLGRPGYSLNIEAVIDAAAAHMVSIEINANPSRLDLDWRYLRRARDKGMKIPIDTDAHSIAGLDDMRYGVYIARKGWLTASDVLNAFPLEKLLKYFQEQRNKH